MIRDTVTIHKYTVIEKIGAGGFSTIFKAKYCNSDKMVAIKMVKSADHSKMILNESKIISYLNRELKMRNPCFPILHWYGTFSKSTCLVTTFYDFSFADALTIADRDILKKLDLCSQMIEIMHHIHSVGVIHCDVKPDNFMMNDENRLVLIDFGMARLFANQSNGTHTPNRMSDTFFGTPKYVSFYLHLGNRPSRRDDMISIGYLMMQVFGVELPWSNISGQENSYDVHNQSNVARLEMKHTDSLCKYLVSLSNRDINHYLIPYFKEVCALKYDDDPRYAVCNSIFNILHN